MESWRKAGGLLRLADLNIRRSQGEIARLEAERLRLTARRADIERQIASVNALLLAEYRHNQVLDRAGIYEARRHEAVLRAQLSGLFFETDTLLGEEARLAMEQQTCQARLRYWSAKQNKFQRWVADKRREARMKRDLADEAETQERTVWNR
ncbi:hypothetical protein [Paludibacterium paludis]|uniref:Uncharacterized protein n=1 Tax=Paludibacterium paludis TaxID=1225769 RepID=A0A918P603_9NEIS|nr:hypothetical protein [Paludibacterium paludis]GGY23993.1 hypothetical protein GCM10011289_29650 [Paludibacterium paludis]